MGANFSVKGATLVVCQDRREGNHGEYIITTTVGVEGSITLSVDGWREARFPEPGEILLLWNISMKRSGWRAKFGKRYQFMDKLTRKQEDVLVKLKKDEILERR